MHALTSHVDTSSDAAQANRAAMEALVGELRERLGRVALGGPEASRQRHVARGKLLARDRIDALLDPGSPFLEVAPLAAWGVYGKDVDGTGGQDAPSAGVVAGIGLVHGRHVTVSG